MDSKCKLLATFVTPWADFVLDECHLGSLQLLNFSEDDGEDVEWFRMSYLLNG